MKSFAKRIAATLPTRIQQELKRIHFARQLKAKRFITDEKEYALLDTFVEPGDWVLDIGANVGHYTARLSDLVGPEGRVIAIEPIPNTFELLAANVARLAHQNVTLLNIAASDSTAVVGMTIPRFESGLDNYYMAHLSNEKSDLNVLCEPVDGLSLPRRVSLVKIDAEGHELSVLKGMRHVLQRDRPTLIVEDNVPEVIPFLQGLRYSSERLEGSSNRIFRSTGSNAPH